MIELESCSNPLDMQILSIYQDKQVKVAAKPMAWSQHYFVWSENLCSKHAKLHTVIAHNNRDHPSWSLYATRIEMHQCWIKHLTPSLTGVRIYSYFQSHANSCLLELGMCIVEHLDVLKYSRIFIWNPIPE